MREKTQFIFSESLRFWEGFDLQPVQSKLFYPEEIRVYQIFKWSLSVFCCKYLLYEQHYPRDNPMEYVMHSSFNPSTHGYNQLWQHVRGHSFEQCCCCVSGSGVFHFIEVDIQLICNSFWDGTAAKVGICVDWVPIAVNNIMCCKFECRAHEFETHLYGFQEFLRHPSILRRTW